MHKRQLKKSAYVHLFNSQRVTCVTIQDVTIQDVTHVACIHGKFCTKIAYSAQLLIANQSLYQIVASKNIALKGIHFNSRPDYIKIQ